MIGGATRVFGLLGRPVAHSRSPALHNAWFAEAGLDAVYVAFDVDDPGAIDAAWQLGLAGANVTAPLKRAALRASSRCEPDAERIGAVNTLVRTERGWLGANTDAEGLCRSLEARGIGVDGRRVVILGAGGAARAAAVGVAGRGARSVAIHARRVGAAAEVAALVGGTAGLLDAAAIDGATLVIVATSGRAEAVGALDPTRLGPNAAWLDLNYWDPDPPGFARAAAAGVEVVDGLPMLVWQAALAFERWTGGLPAVTMGAVRVPRDRDC